MTYPMQENPGAGPRFKINLTMFVAGSGGVKNLGKKTGSFHGI